MATQLGPNLADLLLEHPFGDDAALLYTVDRSLSAGAARRAARTAAEALRAAGVQPDARMSDAVQLIGRHLKETRHFAQALVRYPAVRTLSDP